jgi:hypothetical protein
MKFSPFSCPIFLGRQRARGRCSQGERVLYGRDLCRSGGTGKAEPAKLPGAGIGPKQCPRKCAAEKGLLTKLNDNAFWNRTRGSSQRRSKASLQETTSSVEDGALKSASRRAEILRALTNMIKCVTTSPRSKEGK